MSKLHSELAADRAASVKTYALPQRLYRYRATDTPAKLDREIKAIEDGFVFCPSYDQMNDPMEGLHRESAIFKASESYKTKIEATLRERNKLGIASFSETYNHEPMWAHYAGNFNGICIAYSFGRLLKALTNEPEFVRISYSEQPPLLQHDRKSPKHLARMMLSVKTTRWMNEREWRLISVSRGPAIYVKIDCVAAVYLGVRLSETASAEIKERLEAIKVPTLRMAINKYELTFARPRVPRRK